METHTHTRKIDDELALRRARPDRMHATHSEAGSIDHLHTHTHIRVHAWISRGTQ